MRITSAKDVVFRGVTIDSESGAAVILKNSTGVDTGGLKAKAANAPLTVSETTYSTCF